MFLLPPSFHYTLIISSEADNQTEGEGVKVHLLPEGVEDLIVSKFWGCRCSEGVDVGELPKSASTRHFTHQPRLTQCRPSPRLPESRQQLSSSSSSSVSFLVVLRHFQLFNKSCFVLFFNIYFDCLGLKDNWTNSPSKPVFCSCWSCFISFLLFFPERVMFALGLDLKHRKGKVIGSDAALRKQRGSVVGVVMATVISHHTTGLSPVTWVKRWQ